MDQYLLAGAFTGNLDFIAHFQGQQDASAKWLCIFCLAMQGKLGETFRLRGNAPRFPKRTGEHSLQNMYEVYQKEYLSLDEKDQTPSKTEQVTKDLSYSVVAKALADILLDCIIPADMHVILGLMKKIVKWILVL